MLLALPFASLRLAFTDAGTEPSSYTSRQAYDLLAQGFGPGTNGPLVVALRMPAAALGGPAAIAALRSDLASQPDVAQVSPPQFSPPERPRY